MLLILPNLVLWIIATIGLGYAGLSLLFGTSPRSPGDFLSLRSASELASLSGFTGLWILAMVGVFANFVVPLGGEYSLVICVLGLICFFLFFRKHLSSYRLGLWVLLLALVLGLACAASRELRHGDTGIYHMQAVKWSSLSPIVPGLANLHGRFGFNSTWWSIAAGIELPWLERKSVFLANGLLLFFYGGLLIASLKRLFAKACDAGDVVVLASFYLWYRQIVAYNTPSLSTDLPANLLILVTTMCLARGLRRGDEAFSWCCLALGFAVLAATVKTFAMPLLLGTTVAIAAKLAKSRSLRSSGENTVIRGGAICAAFLATWMLRGILLSGYPLYPSPVAGLPNLPWAIPESKLETMQQVISGWARHHGSRRLSSSTVMYHWIAAQKGERNIAFGLALVGSAWFLALVSVANRSAKHVSLTPYFVPGLIAFGGLVFCLVMAPALRFASGYFFSLIGMVAGFALARLSINSRQNKWKLVGCSAMVVISLWLNGADHLSRSLELWDWPPLPAVQLDVETTRQGIAVYVPVGSPQAWDAPLPSTPYFDAELRATVDDEGRVVRFFTLTARGL